LKEQKQLAEDEEELEMSEYELCNYQEITLPFAKKEHAKLKKAFQTLWKERGRADNQVRNHIEKILQKRNMRTQAYHGGDKYTGVDIGILMEKSDEIMTEIEKYLRDLNHPLKEATDEEIATRCDLIKRVLNLLDILFSILRKNHGQVTDKDLVTYENASDQAALLWHKLDLNYTPSFHYLHKEALRALRRHRGFGELTEDHLEQSHQKMDKIHRRLGRLGFGAKRAMAISRLEKIASDPELVMKIALVKEERKRDYKKMSKGQEKKAAQKTMKTERRINNLDDEMAKQK
jgi:hypothetical protein